MAQKTIVTLIDDIDGSSADETVHFSLDDVKYEIDLTSGHAQELRDSLAQYVSAARKKHSGVGRPPKPKPVQVGPTASEVRAWAQKKNIDVNSYGRVSKDVIDAYNAAH